MSLRVTGWGLVLGALALGAVPAPAADVDRYVPADATAVAVVNVRQLLRAPLLQGHAADLLRTALHSNAGLQGVLNAAGVDPLRDVESVVFAAAGTKVEQGLVIVHGTFDVGRARKAAEEFARQHPQQFQLRAEGATVVYENRSAKRPYFAAFADGGTAVASLSRERVVAALRAGPQPLALRPELQALVGKADATKGAWLAALAPPELGKQLKGNENTAEIADKLKAFTAVLDVDRDVRADVFIHTTGARAAASVAELVDGLRGVAKLLAQTRPEVGDLVTQAVDGMKVGTRKGTVEVRIRVSGDAIEKALKAAKRE